MTHAATVVLLAAGQGTRMRTAGPKVLQPLCGRPMLAYVVDQALGLEPDRVLVVVGHQSEVVVETLGRDAHLASRGAGERIGWVVQEQQLGTGHAVQCCAEQLARGQGPVVVLYGDMPCLRTESIAGLLDAWRDETDGQGIALLTARVDDPRGFGRIVRDTDGGVAAIVEQKDATEEQLALREVNLGVYVFAREQLLAALPRLAPDNAQAELYLTDLVSMAREQGRRVAARVLDDPVEAIGVNTLAHLAEARRGVQDRILEEHLANGVYIEDPATTYIDHGVEIGTGTRILPCTVIRGGVRVGAGCEVGPFTQLRVGTVLADGAEVGNFTECKKAVLGPHTKAKHLSYLGDVTIGERANIGAGTIIANYDGTHKHPTTIGDRAFIGSGSVLIAPVDVGDGALTGGGAIVTRNSEIPPGEAWVGIPARPLPPKRASDSGEPQGS